MSKRPTHRIKALKPQTSETAKVYNEVGAGWVNDDGSFSISLNVGVTLSWNDGLTVTAFPVELKNESKS